MVLNIFLIPNRTQAENGFFSSSIRLSFMKGNNGLAQELLRSASGDDRKSSSPEMEDRYYTTSGSAIFNEIRKLGNDGDESPYVAEVVHASSLHRSARLPLDLSFSLNF